MNFFFCWEKVILYWINYLFNTIVWLYHVATSKTVLDIVVVATSDSDNLCKILSNSHQEIFHNGQVTFSFLTPISHIIYLLLCTTRLHTEHKVWIQGSLAGWGFHHYHKRVRILRVWKFLIFAWKTKKKD